MRRSATPWSSNPDPGPNPNPNPSTNPNPRPKPHQVNALVTLGTEEAYAAIDRPALRRFLLSMKREDGGFSMHDDGECDVRGAYTAVAVASLCALARDRGGGRGGGSRGQG